MLLYTVATPLLLAVRQPRRRDACRIDRPSSVAAPHQFRSVFSRFAAAYVRLKPHHRHFLRAASANRVSLSLKLSRSLTHLSLTPDFTTVAEQPAPRRCCHILRLLGARRSKVKPPTVLVKKTALAISYSRWDSRDSFDDGGNSNNIKRNNTVGDFRSRGAATARRGGRNRRRICIHGESGGFLCEEDFGESIAAGGAPVVAGWEVCWVWIHFVACEERRRWGCAFGCFSIGDEQFY